MRHTLADVLKICAKIFLKFISHEIFLRSKYYKIFKFTPFNATFTQSSLIQADIKSDKIYPRHTNIYRSISISLYLTQA